MLSGSYVEMSGADWKVKRIKLVSVIAILLALNIIRDLLGFLGHIPSLVFPEIDVSNSHDCASFLSVYNIVYSHIVGVPYYSRAELKAYFPLEQKFVLSRVFAIQVTKSLNQMCSSFHRFSNQILRMKMCSLLITR